MAFCSRLTSVGNARARRTRLGIRTSWGRYICCHERINVRKINCQRIRIQTAGTGRSHARDRYLYILSLKKAPTRYVYLTYLQVYLALLLSWILGVYATFKFVDVTVFVILLAFFSHFGLFNTYTYTIQICIEERLLSLDVPLARYLGHATIAGWQYTYTAAWKFWASPDWKFVPLMWDPGKFINCSYDKVSGTYKRDRPPTSSHVYKLWQIGIEI